MLLPPLRQLAQVLGGDVRGDQVLAPGPGHSPRDRSLSVRLTEKGFIVHSFAGDDPLACKDYVHSKLGLPPWQPGDERDRRIHPSKVRAFDRAWIDIEGKTKRPHTEDDLLRIKRATEIWNQASDPRGTIAETYLRSRRLALTDDLAGTVLRFHPHTPWRNENTGRTDRVPALIAAFRSIDDDSITAIHRTALSPDGAKIDRRMLGIVHRAAVKLDPLRNEIAIGEGVETCMAARQLGYQPVWALGSVGAISFFPVLDGVRRLQLLSETGEASAEAIRLCGSRWYRAGRRVRIIRPDPGCSDLNDELMVRQP